MPRIIFEHIALDEIKEKDAIFFAETNEITKEFSVSYYDEIPTDIINIFKNRPNPVVRHSNFLRIKIDTSELEADLIKTTNENLALVEQCEQLRKKYESLEILYHHDRGLRDLENKAEIETLSKIIEALKQENEGLLMEIIKSDKEYLELQKELILNLNKQIGEMKGKTANTVIKLNGES